MSAHRVEPGIVGRDLLLEKHLHAAPFFRQSIRALETATDRGERAGLFAAVIDCCCCSSCGCLFFCHWF